MPFGLCNESDEYQQRKYRALEGLKGVASIADDTLVFGLGETVDEAIKQHDQNLQALLERARQSNLKFNIKKLRLRLPEVKYMGH